VDLNALAGMQSMDATSFPPSWRREGVFAEVKGPGEATFPAVAANRYVCEADVRMLRTKDGALRIQTGEAEICLEGPDQEEMVRCRLLTWRSGIGYFVGECRFGLRERVHFKLLVADGRACLLLDGVPRLEINNQPVDLALHIVSEGQSTSTVYRCSCRPVEDDDLRAVNWPLPPARLALDPKAAAKRLQERTAGLDNKPAEGKRFLAGAVSSPLTWIAPGEFDLGSRDPKAPEGTRKHRVRLTKGFWMGQYEVTQGEWAKLMPTNPSRFQGSPSLPVDSVRWEDAMRFCKELTGREKAAARLPEGYEYRLPTEAEWEYAGRAGSDEEFSVSPAQIWCLETSTQQPHEVGAFPPNAWGLYDMQGDVREWCHDAWYSYPKPEAGTVENPVHPGNPAKDEFVVRGGAWWMSRDKCGISARDRNLSTAVGHGGFRIVLGPAIRGD
jgi:formylglycine-generating enzyme required for sulfatase activity